MSVLHYNGDVVQALLEETMGPMGPDTGGAWWVPVDADYDPEKDRTTAKFKSGTYQDCLNWIDAMGIRE